MLALGNQTYCRLGAKACSDFLGHLNAFKTIVTRHRERFLLEGVDGGVCRIVVVLDDLTLARLSQLAK
jgi:hypothetical protein